VRRMCDVRVLRGGRYVQQDYEFPTYMDPDDTAALDMHLRWAAIRDGQDPAAAGEYVIEIYEHGQNDRLLRRHTTGSDRQPDRRAIPEAHAD
jgi:hypothetical protein